MNNPQIIQTALDQLKVNTGFQGKWKADIAKRKNTLLDGQITLKIRDQNIQLIAEVKKELRLYQLDGIANLAQQHQPFILIAENIFPKLKEALRERNIAYLDTAGNIFLATDRTYLWIDGREVTAETKQVTNRAFTKTGLKVVFHVLLHKDAINQPYREIAAATGVALGNINNVIEGLWDAGFILQIDKRRMALINKKELLERWIAGYQETLKPALYKGDFFLKPDEQADNWKKHKINVPDTVWGGEPAAEELTNYLKPARLTIYTTQAKHTLANNLKLIPGKGQVKMYEKFWKDEEPTLYAPPLLVYADLMITDDPRCIETALLIYDKYLKDEFE